MIIDHKTTAWCLSGRVADDGPNRDIPINTSPFRVGRSPGLALCLAQQNVSNVHAELVLEESGIWVRDLGSTNGTYVNGSLVEGTTALRDGDLVHFADVTFRLKQKRLPQEQRTRINALSASDHALALLQFDKLMSEKAVIPHFQPIVTLLDRTIVGYEVLSRSRLAGLQLPYQMFSAASELNLEEELSRMLRRVGLEKGHGIQQCPNLFLNTCPAEIVTPGLLLSLRRLREAHPHQPITIEVHEAAANDADAMVKLGDSLRELNMQIAYDDFGAGQSRLVALHTVRPDFVKFDISLIHNIDQATTPQRRMVGSLVQMVRELGIVAIAEGVEREEEHRVLCDLGFGLGQGYFYGRPERR